MIETSIFQILSLVSFLYSFWLMFFYLGTTQEMALLFTIVFLGSLIYTKLHKHGWFHRLCGIVLLAPLLWLNTPLGIAMTIINATIIIFYIENTMDLSDMWFFVYAVKASYGIYFAVFCGWVFFSAFMQGFMLESLAEGWPFIFLYIMSSVVLLRTQRHLEANLDKAKIRRSNLKYMLIMLAVFIPIVLDDVRTRLFDIAGIIAKEALSIILAPIYWIFRNYKLTGLDEVQPSYGQGDSTNNFVMEVVEEPSVRPIAEEASTVDWVTWGYRIILVITILVICLIIYLVLSDAFNRKRAKGDGFIEEREFIRNPKKKRRGFLGLFNRDPYPKDNSNRIRYYYRKYIKGIEGHNINIVETDTSLDIKGKATLLSSYDQHEIRDLYLKGRYSDTPIDDQEVEQMSKLWDKV